MRSLYGEDGIDEVAWDRAMAALAAETCDRRGCHEPATGGANCPDCRRAYRRCEAHGSGAGALRSLHSHAALEHPRRSL